MKLNIEKIKNMLYELEELNNNIYDYIENNIDDNNPHKDNMLGLSRELEKALYRDYSEVEKAERDEKGLLDPDNYKDYILKGRI